MARFGAAAGLPRVAIEAGVTDFWRKYVGLEGAVVGVDRFGESAPAADVYKFLGVDAEHLVAAVQARCLTSRAGLACAPRAAADAARDLARASRELAHHLRGHPAARR